MSKRIVALLASLLVFAVAHGQSSFPDVPDRHWAEASVARLADLGILMGFPDGTFRGNESITRYEAALVIDRLLTAVRDDSDAADAAILNQLETLRAVVMALADETEELQRRSGANRDALDALWAEVLALREELDLPPPAPLPPYPPAPADEDAAPASERPVEDVAPAEGSDDTAGAPAEASAEDAVSEDTDAQQPEDAPPGQEDGATAEEPMRPIDPDRPVDDQLQDAPDDRPVGESPQDVDPAADDVDALASRRQPTAVYASVAGGAAVPRRWLVRATVGVENLVADGFGARLSLDLGRRSPTPLASVTLLGHATYRLAEPAPLGGYVGAGGGVGFGGDGAFASVLVGGTWSALDPVLLFAEATLDVYVAPALPSGGSRLGPTLVVGARLTF